MEFTLIVNPGSSSKKYALYEGDKQLLTLKYEKTADGFAECIRINKEQQCSDISEVEYGNALQSALDTILQHKVIGDTKEITKVGIRIVAPSEEFASHQKIDSGTVDKLQALENTAPLHIPPILDEIVAVTNLLPEALHIGVSDSAFHQTIPEHFTTYSLKGAEENGVRRFGYHGLSVGSISRRLEKVVGADFSKVVVMHVGNGVSVTGVREGKSVWTSMGYTPASGLMMGSRAGDLDPGALITILDNLNLSGVEAQKYIQTEGGFVGLTGERDIRKVLDMEANKDDRAHLAMENFVSGIAGAASEASMAMGGVDVVVTTGTAAERNDYLRQRILEKLSWLGLELDEAANENVYSLTQVISKKGSKITAAVVPTDEMGEMALACQKF